MDNDDWLAIAVKAKAAVMWVRYKIKTVASYFW